MVTSLHEANFAIGLLEDLWQFGREITYHAPRSNAVTLTAIVGQVQTATEDDAEGGRTLQQTRSVTISRDPDGEFSGVATPFKEADTRERSYFTIDGDEWTIAEVESETPSLARLRCVRGDVLELTRPGYSRG